MRKLFLYIACSVDGYIAAENDNLDFLSMVEQEGEDYGYAKFYSTIDTVIIGRRTYDIIREQLRIQPHPDKQTFVITHTSRPAAGNTVFYTGDPCVLARELKQEPGKNIFCDGGSEIIHQLLQQNLVDEMIISIIPVILGRGTRLFKEGTHQHTLKLAGVKSFKSGLVQLDYKNA